MSKHIVNKHFDTVEEIKKSVFHSDANFAKGEVIVYNGENPSLYVLDINGEPAMVRGNITEGDVENILSGVNEDIKTVIETMDENEIVTSFALNELNLRYLDIDERLEMLEYIDHENYKRGDEILRNAFNAADLQLERTLDTKIKNVSSHMINGKKLNENPYINASDINVDEYSSLRLPEGSEKDIVDTDTVQMALKKMENKIIELTDALEKLNNFVTQLSYRCIMDDNGYYILISGVLNVIEEPLNYINFKFNDEEINSSAVYRVAFITGDDIVEVNLPVNNYSMPISELEPNTKYIFNFTNDFVEIEKA